MHRTPRLFLAMQNPERPLRPLPQREREKMEALRKMPPPPLERVQRQLKASEEYRKNSKNWVKAGVTKKKNPTSC